MKPAPALAFLSLVSALAAPRPTLTLGPAGSGIVSVESGSMVNVPEMAIVPSMEVRLPQGTVPPSARDHLQIHVDGHDLRGKRSFQGNDVVLRANNFEPLGMFRRREQTLEVISFEGFTPTTVASWQITRAEKPYVEIRTSTPGAPAPDVTIDQPLAGAIMQAGPLRIQGSVTGGGTYVITVQGSPVARALDRSGWGFDTEVALDGTAANLAICVKDARGSTTTLVLPVRHRQ